MNAPDRYEKFVVPEGINKYVCTQPFRDNFVLLVGRVIAVFCLQNRLSKGHETTERRDVYNPAGGPHRWEPVKNVSIAALLCWFVGRAGIKLPYKHTKMLMQSY
jgi:hypothetical protein